MTKIEMYLHTFMGNTIARSLYKDYVESLDLLKSKKILEFGCGAGCVTKFLINKMNPNSTLSCLDIDNEAIDLAKNRFRDYDNINFYVGDIRKLDIEKNSFDTIIVHYMLHDVKDSDRKGILDTLNSLLSMNGKLYIREPIKEGHGIAPSKLRELLKNSNFIELSGHLEKKLIGGEMFSATFEKA